MHKPFAVGHLAAGGGMNVSLANHVCRLCKAKFSSISRAAKYCDLCKAEGKRLRVEGYKTKKKNKSEVRHAS